MRTEGARRESKTHVQTVLSNPSTEQNSDSGNTETNVMVLDNYVTNCFSTYREVLDRASFDYEMVCCVHADCPFILH